jgi:hypothetical protein
MSIVILTEGQTPDMRCRTGDIYIRQSFDGWWIYSWDGYDARAIGDKPYATREEAETFAREALTTIGPDDPEPLILDPVEVELIEAWRRVPAHRAAWCRGILLAVLREMSARN